MVISAFLTVIGFFINNNNNKLAGLLLSHTCSIRGWSVSDLFCSIFWTFQQRNDWMSLVWRQNWKQKKTYLPGLLLWQYDWPLFSYWNKYALFWFCFLSKRTFMDVFCVVKSSKTIAQHFSRILKVLNPLDLTLCSHLKWFFQHTKSYYFFFTANTLLRHNFTFLLCVYYRSSAYLKEKPS